MPATIFRFKANPITGNGIYVNLMKLSGKICQINTFIYFTIYFWRILVIWNHCGQQQQARRGERPLGGTVTPQTDPLGAGAGQTIIIIQTRNQLGLHWLGGVAETGGDRRRGGGTWLEYKK